MLREKREKLQVYEFLYNRLPFTDAEKEELLTLQQVDALEASFHEYLSQISTRNIEVVWHCDIEINHKKHIINVMMATDYCYYIFILHDFSGKHSVNAFNILCDKAHNAVYDLNQSDDIYEQFRLMLIDEGKYQRPIMVKHVMMDATFSVTGNRKDNILKLDDLPFYLKAIESAAKIRKKYQRPL